MLLTVLFFCLIITPKKNIFWTRTDKERIDMLSWDQKGRINGGKNPTTSKRTK